MRRERTIKHKNIARVDHDASRTHGYNVRMQWQGEQRLKFFADKLHGDRLAALAAAIDWRDAMEKELGKPRTERTVIGIIYSSSGVPGVRRIRQGHTNYYEATWATTAGKQARTKFSIAKHGERKALALAKRARARGEKARLETPAHPDKD
jgi:hypothetical protein